MSQNTFDPARLVQQKQLLRARALTRRQGMSAQERAKASARATAHFLKNIALPTRADVAVFWSIGDEINTEELISALRARGHNIGLPVVVGPDRPLVFRAWDGCSELIKAGFGTRIPVPEAPQMVPAHIVVPLAAVDNRGARLGYGKGFYDRTIGAMRRRPQLIGFAFEAQKLEFVPQSTTDIALDMLVSEAGITRFDKGQMI